MAANVVKQQKGSGLLGNFNLVEAFRCIDLFVLIVQDCGVNHIKEFTIFVLIELLKRYGFEKYKNTLFYFGVTGLFSALIF
jgi:hypothetical protein